MKSFSELESVVFNIHNQKILTKAFFTKLHDKYLNKEVEINQDEIKIPTSRIEEYKDNSHKKIRGMTGVIEEKGDDFLFSSQVSYLIREYFGVEKKKQDNEEGNEDYREEREALGVMTREAFEEKYPNRKLETQQKDYEFVPMPTMSYNDFCIISNSYPQSKFIMNPLLATTEYSSNGSISIQKVEVDIKKQVITGDRFGKKIATKFSIQCKCGKSLLIYPSDIHSKIAHTCGWEVTEKGKDKPIIVTLDKSGLCPVAEKEMWLYETKIPNIKDSNKNDTVHLYTFESDIAPGRYVVDIWNAYIWENKSKSYNFYPVILGYKKKDIKIRTDLITLNNQNAVKYCDENNLPYARFLDVLFSLKTISSTYGGRDIDERGMLLQLFITVSSIGKHLNHFDKLGILAMGNKSLSKTYPSYLLGMITDSDFQHVGSSQDVSLAGLRGGINNKKMINGQVTSMFEKGIFSVAGQTLFDEGELFFSNPEMNMVLKTFLDEYIDIKKIGGDKIEQSYTPMIMSNFPLEFNGKYTKEVKDAYERLNKIGEEKHEHGNSREEIASYISDINLYLPVSRYVNDYRNQTLAKTIAYVRHNFGTKGIDWRTGGSLPSSYRLLFDVVCWNVEEHSFKDEDRIIGQTESVLPQQGVFPTIEFVETLKSLYGKNKINLKFEHLNKPEVVQVLHNLEEDINEWFRSDEKGKIVFAHLANGTIQIDPKLNGLVYTFIKIIQLFEDIANTGAPVGKFNDNIKEWAFLILSKCKRGVTKDEYDFKEHYMDIVPKNEKFSMLEAEIEKIKSMEEDSKMESIIEKKFKEHEKSSMAITEEVEMDEL